MTSQQETAESRLAVYARPSFRFRMHSVPFVWAVFLAVAGLVIGLRHITVLPALAAGVVTVVLAVVLSRHAPRFPRRWWAAAAVVTAAWLPLAAVTDVTPPLRAALAAVWACFTIPWMRRYAWTPGSPAEQPESAPKSAPDAPAKWAATLGRKGTLKDSKLTDPQDLGGDGEKYTLELVPGEQDTSTVFAAARKIASLFGKPVTEVYPERFRGGREDRVHLTVLTRNTLEQPRTWDGASIDPFTGMAVIGRFPDGKPVHFRFWSPRNGCEQSIVAGVKGAGKTSLLSLLASTAITSTVPVIPIILDPQQGQSLPDWRGRVPYAEGPDQCMAYLRAFDAGMTARSLHLAHLPWTDDDGYERPGMPFFDPVLADLPVMFIIFDEAHLLIRDKYLGEETRYILSNLAKLNRKAGGHLVIASHALLLEELGSFTMRANLVSGNVVCLRTGERMSSGVAGLEADPHLLPAYFDDGSQTFGLGYTSGPDGRPDAPMRADDPGNARRTAVENDVAEMDEVFAAAWRKSLNGGQGDGQEAREVAEEQPETVTLNAVSPAGDDAASAVLAALTTTGTPMRTEDVIAAASCRIAAVTRALRQLAEDGQIVKLGDRGPYIAHSDREAAS